MRTLHELAATVLRALKLAEQSPYFDTRLQTGTIDKTSSGTLPAQNEVRPYSIDIFGARVIEQDDTGRLYIAPLRRMKKMRSFRIHKVLRTASSVVNPLDSALADHDLVPIFTGSDMSALACNEASPGDIIAIQHYGAVVLRAQDDGLSFIVVGQAIIVTSDKSSEPVDEPDCDCRPEPHMNNYKIQYLKLTLRVSDEDAIAAVSGVFTVEFNNGDILEYLKNYSLGKLARGSILSDVSMLGVDKERSIGPPNALCATHKAAENNRVTRQALWHSINSKSGPIVWVSK